MEGEKGPDLGSIRDHWERSQKRMNRREFLRKTADTAAAIAAPTVFGTVFGPLAWEWGQNQLNAEELTKAIESHKKEISETYGVTVAIDPGEFPLEDEVQTSKLFTKEIASLYIRFKAVEGLQQILAVYPPMVIKKYVREIRVTKEMQMVNASGSDTAAGTIDYAKKLVVVDVMPLFDTHAALLGNVPSRKTLHHEIAHLVCQNITDKDWEALHPGVAYLSFFAKSVRDEDVKEGFIRAHSMTSPAEDIATVSETIFTPGSRYYDKISSDEILRRKASYVKHWYETQSDGRMNETYWKDLSDGKVGEKYWKDR